MNCEHIKIIKFKLFQRNRKDEKLKIVLHHEQQLILYKILNLNLFY